MAPAFGLGNGVTVQESRKFRASDGAILWDHAVASTAALIGMAFDGKVDVASAAPAALIDQFAISEWAAVLSA